jgi:drug/metabolite transporter (DMT)-like permease
MGRVISLGIVSALFFSSTFVLNRAISLEGGHWSWTASLRYGYMLLFLGVILLACRGTDALRAIAVVFLRHWRFWTVAGSVGFGVFYALISFSAAYASGWIVATTWQTTILATPAVLMLCFGKRVPRRGLLLTSLIFIGVVLVNLEHAAAASPREVLLSVVPVLIAAFAYPIGNQMVWEARRGGYRRIPAIDAPILENSLARVTLLCLGSLPFWALLLLCAAPGPPSAGQLLNTALVALLSGVIATSLFLHARHLCRHSVEIAAVDATQSMEVVFSLAGEVAWLHGAWPGPLGLAGMALAVLGLVSYLCVQAQRG